MLVTENRTMWLHPEHPWTLSQGRDTHSQNVPGATAEESSGFRAQPALTRVPLSMFQTLVSFFFLQWKDVFADLYSDLSELIFLYICSSCV